MENFNKNYWYPYNFLKFWYKIIFSIQIISSHQLLFSFRFSLWFFNFPCYFLYSLFFLYVLVIIIYFYTSTLWRNLFSLPSLFCVCMVKISSNGLKSLLPLIKYLSFQLLHKVLKGSKKIFKDHKYLEMY